MPIERRLDLPIFCTILCTLVIAFIAFLGYTKVSFRSMSGQDAGTTIKIPQNAKLELTVVPENKPPAMPGPTSGLSKIQSEQMQGHKLLYFKLQNLEQYPEVLPQSRDLLVMLLSEALEAACKDSGSGILGVKAFTRDNLVQFLQSQDDETMAQWERYMARRKTDSRLRMFPNREEAQWWLKQVAPVKYVDGAWLGHVNKITTPFALRRTTRDAWQVLSEELGDGDLDKNHVQVYRELMKDIVPGLPAGDTMDFIHPRHELNEPSVWKAAIAQLLISLFPHEFLPEILGFNLHFELLTLETLKAAKELAEMKLNSYYFALHISIDNSDSGHTAMAKQAVMVYIEHVEETQGHLAGERVWKRIQAGYILSERCSTSVECPSSKTTAVDSFPSSKVEAEVVSIFKAKAPVAHKVHCSSQMRIGRQTLVDWLAPEAFDSKQWQKDFLDDLKNMPPWVRKGQSSKSKLIKELSWPGKMFGSFTQNEVEVVKRWIDELRDPDPKFYWTFVHRADTPSSHIFQDQDICVDYPVLSSLDLATVSSPLPNLHPESAEHLDKIIATSNMSGLCTLWFAHQCLLESFVCVPAKTTTRSACAVVRLLRAQYGFGAEGPGVAGMDEVRREDRVGLVELGLEMMQRAGLAEPAHLADVLDSKDPSFARDMLHWSMHPVKHASFLLGLTAGFVDLHDAVSSSPSLLSPGSRDVLAQIACRERNNLEVCLDELRENHKEYAEFQRGHRLAMDEIALLG